MNKENARGVAILVAIVFAEALLFADTVGAAILLAVIVLSAVAVFFAVVWVMTKLIEKMAAGALALHRWMQQKPSV